MSDDMIPKMVYMWDKSLKTDAWARSVDFVLQSMNIYESVDDLQQSFESVEIQEEFVLKHVDIDMVKNKLLKSCREKWWVAASEMPKLRTFMELYNDQDHRGLVYTHLTRRQRSLVVKFKIGIMSLSIEKGRFTNVPLENRLCHICSEDLLEDEYHFILFCDALKDVRTN